MLPKIVIDTNSNTLMLGIVYFYEEALCYLNALFHLSSLLALLLVAVNCL